MNTTPCPLRVEIAEAGLQSSVQPQVHVSSTSARNGRLTRSKRARRTESGLVSAAAEHLPERLPTKEACSGLGTVLLKPLFTF